ncbi:phosphatidate cytidylyltransferase [Oscillibacter sp. PC13]|uniref:phosphatidate cytidylyltransferase n=1 Tax=Oscillibacter sp. PC13 TaxID=1855299 RepID=UPI0008F39433|nr:phosphatidate cytidylyltransferase [Oscillibacter sp. PC13]SFP54102.1 phosphatidate cytidylyltransferase [Oscillibacter sp. PC13]
MKQRWLVVVVGLPLMLLVLLACPSWATMLLVCGISAIAAYELLHVAGKNVPKAVCVFTMLAAVGQSWVVYDERKWSTAVGLVTYGSQEGAPIDRLWILPLAFVMILFLAAVRAYEKELTIPFTDLCIAVMGGIVFPMMYSCIFLLRMQPDYGKLYVLAPFAVAFLGDAFAMYGGMLLKGPKMSPRVSPHKTWSGAVSGVVGGVLGLVVLGFIGSKWLGYEPNYRYLVEAGIAANVLGQLGDLSMSLIKREAGVKDYSHLFLTHGGMLDRFDSSMFIAPVIYLYVAEGML